MNKVLIISKSNCAPCAALKQYISSLSDELKEDISILDESTSTKDELHSILHSYGSFGFPTIILQSEDKERLITGFSNKTAELIKNHLC